MTDNRVITFWCAFVLFCARHGMAAGQESQLPERPDGDFVIMLHEWVVEGGTYRPNTIENVDFNLLTMNGTVMPARLNHPRRRRKGVVGERRIGDFSGFRSIWEAFR